jgi:hypothetical protein
MEKLTKEKSLEIYRDRLEGLKFFLRGEEGTDHRREYMITSEWKWNGTMLSIKVVRQGTRIRYNWWIDLDSILGELDHNKRWIPFGTRKASEQVRTLELWQK